MPTTQTVETSVTSFNNNPIFKLFPFKGIPWFATINVQSPLFSSEDVDYFKLWMLFPVAKIPVVLETGYQGFSL